MIVVDTNVVAYLFLEGERTAQAERILRRDPEWAAPLLWRSELRNILASYVRRGALALELAQRIAAEAEALLRGKEYAVRTDHVLAASAASGCTAYDCELAVLAEAIGVPLVTADKKLVAAFPRVAHRMESWA